MIISIYNTYYKTAQFYFLANYSGDHREFRKLKTLGKKTKKKKRFIMCSNTLTSNISATNQFYFQNFNTPFRYNIYIFCLLCSFFNSRTS